MINQRWQPGRCNDMRDEAMIEGEQEKEVAHSKLPACLRCVLITTSRVMYTAPLWTSHFIVHCIWCRLSSFAIRVSTIVNFTSHFTDGFTFDAVLFHPWLMCFTIQPSKSDSYFYFIFTLSFLLFFYWTRSCLLLWCEIPPIPGVEGSGCEGTCEMPRLIRTFLRTSYSPSPTGRTFLPWAVPPVRWHPPCRSQVLTIAIAYFETGES